MRFCSLFSGSSGNCLFVGTDNAKILIDGGVSGSKIATALKEIGENPEDLSAIFVTHEHNDHISGVGIMSRKYNIPIIATEKTWKAMRNSLGKLSEENIVTMNKGTTRTINDIQVKNFATSHDAADPVAYSFECGGKKVAIATDTGCITQEVRDNVIGSDLILLESNHDVDMLKNGIYPDYLKKRILGDRGHLSNVVAADFLTELALSGTKHFFLGHLSQENNTPECAFETSENMLRERELKVGRDLDLWVAKRHTYSRVVDL